jgi:hypothetical protein
MNTTQSSRRQFLGSLAMLSAGTAFGSVTRLIPTALSPDLQQQWKQFWKQNGGRPSMETEPQNAANTLVAGKGHFYQNGPMIAFSEHNLLAQPTWVYWTEQKTKPADIIITFFKNDAAKTKLFRLNRFELEALNELPKEEGQKEVLTLLKEATQKPSDDRKAPLMIKAKVQKDQQVSVHTRFFEKEFSKKKQLIYHT